MSVRQFVLDVVAAASFAAALAIRILERGARPWLRLWRLVRLQARVDGAVPVTTQFDGPVETGGRTRLELGEHCRLGRNVFFETGDGGVIRLGANVRLNTGVFIVSHAEITIGRDCLIAEYASIRDADHGYVPGQLMRLQPHTARPIRIGDGAWIARGAVVLKGVTIGEGAIVGANSVVTRDVPAMAIVAGAPARIIGRRGEPARTPAASSVSG